ncbi:GNAT family N-acetyltransferase [Alkalimarinus alittae]|uniref:GNAT family N-acetyltransferase n=1 Tax=Alkalimarinus alittae TaxID=2961619 RepID=A0ABY6N1K8_9ALTE|nr:GNAT family N-acetyltransferase [Alkalimarinus alittae]UZE95969.1 GNAT family N-acetyltransferase [Alkalimarinus alittae]
MNKDSESNGFNAMNPVIMTYEKLMPIAYPLANRFYKQAGEKGKTQSTDSVYVARLGAKIIAAVRLCPVLVRSQGGGSVSQNRLLLRSLAVLPEHRRTGVGRRFMEYVVEQIDAYECWCYPFSWLEQFYSQTDFRLISPEDTPAFIRVPFENYSRQGRDILIMVRNYNGINT